MDECENESLHSDESIEDSINENSDEISIYSNAFSNDETTSGDSDNDPEKDQLKARQIKITHQKSEFDVAEPQCSQPDDDSYLLDDSDTGEIYPNNDREYLVENTAAFDTNSERARDTHESIIHSNQDEEILLTKANDIQSSERKSAAFEIRPYVGKVSDRKSLLCFIAVIDFGKTYTYLSFIPTVKLKEHLSETNVYARQWSSDSGAMWTKAPTCVLIEPDGKTFNSFGFEAESIFSKLPVDERDSWYFFRCITHVLFENKVIDDNAVLEDESGKILSTKSVFSMAIRYLKDDLIKMARERCNEFGFIENDVCWVLTLPAIWYEVISQFVKEAALEAGISPTRLTTVSESDAASFYFCQYEQSKNRDLLLEKTVLVLNTRRDTSDISIYRIKDGEATELYVSSNEECGSTRVEESFLNVLSSIVGYTVMDRFKEQYITEYRDLLLALEKKKSAFYFERDSRFNIRIPASLQCLVQQLGGEELADVVKQPRFSEQVKMRAEKVCIESRTAYLFLEEVVEKIVDYMNRVLNKKWLTDVDEIVMMGEFSRSTVLQSALRDNFPNIKMFVPPDAESAVSQGAILVGNLKASALEPVVPDEIVHDPYALSLYFQALQNGTEIDNRIRLNIVGNFAQGKTTLARRLVSDNIRDVQSTNSIEVSHYKASVECDGKVSYTKNAGDFSSEFVQRLLSVVESQKGRHQIAGDKARMLKQTSLHRQTKDSLDRKEAQTDYCGLNKAAEKTEEKSIRQADSHIQRKETSLLQEKNKLKTVLSNDELKRFSTKVKQNEDTHNDSKELDIWDFGGQYVFNATHKLFQSKRAIYILVFNLSTPLTEIVCDDEFPEETGRRNMEYFLKFWINSIHCFSGTEDSSKPKVILVGTHRDKLVGDESQKQEAADEYFERIRALFDDTELINHIWHNDFAIDNTNPNDISLHALREEIFQMASTHLEKLNIPASWIPLERALKENQHTRIVQFDTVMEMDAKNQFPLYTTEQVKLFLKYHHANGTFVYFEDDEPISNYVILDPQYLIDAFKCFITSKRFHQKNPALRAAMRKLSREARLENSVIDTFWGQEGSTFLEHKDILLEFLKKHHIIAEASEYDEEKKESKGLGWYVVPSLLKNADTENHLEKFLANRTQTLIRFVIVFQSAAIVHMVYDRLLAALLGKWAIASVTFKEKKLLLFENIGLFQINYDHVGIAEIRSNHIELRVVNLCPSSAIDSSKADSFRRYSESVIRHEFRSVCRISDVEFVPYTSAYRCNHISHGLDGSLEIKPLRDLEDGRTVMPCPDSCPHEINVNIARLEWFPDEIEVTALPDTQLTEKQISRIAQAIGENWKLLGIELGVPSVKMDHIAEECQGSSTAIYKMLKIWSDKEAEMATLQKLINVLKKCKKVNIDWDAIKNIIDDTTRHVRIM
ncbi:uncharacterized protein LOC123544548 [Mercenaria mercenaria]|uniref:uncharacterized protein LOC123544548 n=1 Tax=Mercenaria mercenaria TaxID=6596 RepID=UPI00234E98F4|nr:uncharacterized protein LOC123544548 [Mercenaria mercenaria]